MTFRRTQNRAGVRERMLRIQRYSAGNLCRDHLIKVIDLGFSLKKCTALGVAIVRPDGIRLSEMTHQHDFSVNQRECA